MNIQRILIITCISLLFISSCIFDSDHNYEYRELYLPLPKVNEAGEFILDSSVSFKSTVANGWANENGTPVHYIVRAQTFGYWNDSLEYYYYHYLLSTWSLKTQTNFLKPNSSEGVAALFDRIGDRFTHYFDSSIAKEIWGSITTTNVPGAVGISTQAVPTDDTIMVTMVAPNSPAEEVGMRKGDRLLSVDGHSLIGDSMYIDFQKYTAGDSGKTVSLSWLSLSGTIHEATLIKRPVAFPSVLVDTIQGIPYIRIFSFNDSTISGYTTSSEWAKALVETRNMGTTIIDLRRNPGGLVDAATQMLDELYESGVMYREENRSSFPYRETSYLPAYSKQSISATKGGAGLGRTYVYLCDSNSASASEITLASVRDRLNPTIIGEKTYGKGIGQVYLPSPMNAIAGITSAQYKSPNGIVYHGIGIQPTIATKSEDALKTALEHIKGTALAKMNTAQKKRMRNELLATEFNGGERVVKFNPLP